MGRRRIFTVGFDLPGDGFESIPFNSDQTLLDADIVLFEPTLSVFHSYESYNGRELLSENSSFIAKTRVDHWRSEIITAVNAGKLVVVYLSKPDVYYRYTGQQQHSGTGRSRATTNLVAEISSYEAIPNLTKVTAKSGSEICLEKDGAFLGPYWSEVSEYSSYEVEIEGNFTRTLLRSRSGERVVGASFEGKRGALLFLPPIRYDYELFVQDVGAEEEWTAEAQEFGKRLVGALVGLSDVLRRSSQLTPPPEWSSASEFRLALENVLETNITQHSAQIQRMQAERLEFEQQLEDAGSLRRLLYEQGKALELAILEAMRLFGFESSQFQDGESEFDGVFVSVEGRCLGEVEGRDNRAIAIEKFSQLERNLSEDFAREETSEYAKGILFGNAYRLKPPADRGSFFTDKCVSAAQRIGAALIRTPDLFAPAKYLKEHPSDTGFAKACRDSIFSTSGGVVNFPEPPIVETNTVTTTNEEEPSLPASPILSVS